MAAQNLAALLATVLMQGPQIADLGVDRRMVGVSVTEPSGV